MKNIKKNLLHSTALIGASIVVLTANNSAYAATNNFTQSVALSTISDSTSPSGFSCRISATVSFDATVNDGGNRDWVHVAITDAAGMPNPSIPVTSGAAWTPYSLNFPQTNIQFAALTRFTVTRPTSPRTPRFFTVFEATGNTPADRGAILAQQPITDAMYRFSGSECNKVAPNTIPQVSFTFQNSTVPGGTLVPLNGTASDLDGDPVTTTWSQISGPPVTLSSTTGLTSSFVAPISRTQQNIQIRFSGDDGQPTNNTTFTTRTLTVLANSAPIADAGPDANAAGGSTVTLDGTGSSDADGDPLTYTWTQTAGTSVTLSGTNTTTPSFTAPPRMATDQILTFRIAVSDGGRPATDTVEITIPSNASPTVNAGPDATVAAGSSVMLAGSASDPDNDPLTYQWTQTAGPAVALSGGTTLTPSFTAPPKTSAAQILTFSLVGNDGNTNSAPDTVDITVPANGNEVADAGPDQTVRGGTVVTLDATASTDGDGDPLTYSWTQTAGPSVTLSDPNSASPTFTTPLGTNVTQTISFSVTVSDGFGRPDVDDVDIFVEPNSPPVSDAGVDQGPIDSGQTVTLDGSGSSDPDGDNLTYNWRQVSGTQVSLTGGSSATPTFVAPLVNGNEDLVFELIVNDGTVDSPPDTVTVAIRAIGSITIIQRIVGSDTTIAFTSNVAALSGPITTVGGNGQLVAATVPAGSYTISAADLSANGYALTDISCNDGDSVTNLASRSVALALSPNEDLVCTFTSANSREAASSAIRDFLTGRNALIMSHQPDLQRRLDRLQEQPGTGGSATAFGLPIPGSGRLPLNASFSRGQSRVATSLAMASAAVGDPDRGKQPFDIWAEAYFANTALGTQRGSFRIAHLGADYRVNSNLLLGVLGEFDDFSNDGPLAAGEAEGNGWMVGPYAMVRLDKNLFAEVRAAWGKSNNSVSPLGTFVDDFKTSRSFYSGSFIGQFDIGKNTDIRPELTIRHLSDRQKAYVDALNIAIPGQTVDQGDISFRPRIQHTVKLDSGWSLRPFGEVEGIYTFGTDVNNILDNGVRARIEAGLDIFSGGGFRASLSGFHDGIGSDNYRSSGVHVSLSFGF